MKAFRYILDKSPKKYRCPACGRKTFVRFVDQKTGEPLPDFGRCDREQKCGLFLKPTGEDDASWQAPPAPPPQPISYIESDVFRASLAGYENNRFVMWLRTILSEKQVQSIIETYLIGSSNYFAGAVVFWQVDAAGGIRSGKVMQYDQHTGKRVKKPKPMITWVHSAMKFEGFNLKSCFFGLHLLRKESSKPVALVESEKTACLASVHFPDLIWIAAGGLQFLNPDNFAPLAGRQVILFPDLGACDKWQMKADAIRSAYPESDITVSDYLETVATDEDRAAGFDLADYLMKLPRKGEKGEKSEAPKQTFFIQAIKKQLAGVDLKQWIIDFDRLPGISAYNLRCFIDDLKYNHGIEVSRNEYAKAMKAIYCN
jgi:hypothetical protein